MLPRIMSFFGGMSVATRFMLASLAVLAVAMVGVGAWVSRLIEDGVVQRTAAATALYVDSLVAPALQGMAEDGEPTVEGIDELDWLLGETPLGQQVAEFRVWDTTGRVVYSTNPGTVGETIPVAGELAQALAGRVSADIGDIEGEGDGDWGDLLEIYSPVRGRGSDRVIAVAEFYFAADDLRWDIASARRQSWLVVGGAALLIYVPLAVFARRASATIARQQSALAAQVARLTDVLGQNAELHGRVRGAAARAAALNERFLRRISAELHDGPAQDVSLALLRLDDVRARCTAPGGWSGAGDTERDLDLIESSLRHALQEVRGASSELLLPHLEALSVAETLDRAVRGHRQRTRGAVTVDVRGVPERAALATKIALYRIVQEALANGWRHAGGAGQAVAVRGDGAGWLRVEVADGGPGFDPATLGTSAEHLGLVGMRERAESLGGAFRVESAPDRGTRIVADLPLDPDGGGDRA